MVHLLSVENVITLGKLRGLLFCSVPPLYFVSEIQGITSLAL